MRGNMADQVFECPFCHRKFRVPGDATTKQILCPHCTQIVDLPRLPKAVSEITPSQGDESTDSVSVDAIVTECPTCAGAFRVLPSMLHQWVACPHCHARLQIVPPQNPAEAAESALSPPLETPSPPQLPTRISASAATSATALDPELEKLLPPKFLVPGSHQHSAKSLSETHVILPDAHGGFKKLDTSVRQINFAGQAVSITRLPPSTKRRRRTIRSIILFTLCGIILLVAFYVLSR